MELHDLLAALDAGTTVVAGSELHEVMHRTSQKALELVAGLNSGYHEPDEVRAILSELTGTAVPESTTVFPPFYSEFEKNIRFGENVFVNTGCTFQDQGGIRIGDGSLIGHNSVLATLNHAMDPERLGNMEPGPIVLGSNVWVGSGATVLPGVTIGDGTVVAAGAVVTRDVPARTVVAGTPARAVRTVDG